MRESEKIVRESEDKVRKRGKSEEIRQIQDDPEMTWHPASDEMLSLPICSFV